MHSPWVVIPTYCERGNIELIIPKLFELGVKNLHVLVVDDNSPDGTASIVGSLIKKYPNLHVLERKSKSGLGTAYVEGFNFALGKGATCVVQMDADLSHNPEDVPRLLKEIEHNNYGVAIGSRYIGGIRVIDWPFRRLLLSYAGNTYARIISGMPFFDVTGGFRAWRADVIRLIQPEKVRVDGYGFQIATAYRAWKAGARVIEIPIIFTERRVGRSKLSGQIVREALVLVWKLRIFQR